MALCLRSSSSYASAAWMFIMKFNSPAWDVRPKPSSRLSTLTRSPRDERCERIAMHVE